MAGGKLTRDLTRGSPLRRLTEFAIPVFWGLLLQQVYSVVDSIIVGQFLGANALGGIGLTSSIDFLVLQTCIGFCMGFGVPMAQAFGAGDKERLRRLVGNSIWLSMLVAGAVMAVTITFCAEILTALHTPPENFNYALTYLRIIFWGIPFTMLYNLTANIIRAVGDSKTPVVYLTVASVANILLDLLLVAVFDKGVAGAALATILSQLLSGLLCLLHIVRKLPLLHFDREEARFSGKIAGNLMANGLPMAVQYTVTAVGMIAMTSATNSLGADIVNAVAVSNKPRRFLIVPFDVFCTTMATFAGQNTGARKFSRINRGVWDAMLICTPCWIFCMAISYFFSDELVHLFLREPTAEMLRLSFENMFYSSIGFIVLASVDVFRSAIQGMGYSRIAIGAGLAEMIARVICAFVLVPQLGFAAVYLAPTLGWALATVFLVPTYYICLNKLKRKFGEAPESEAVL